MTNFYSNKESKKYKVYSSSGNVGDKIENAERVVLFNQLLVVARRCVRRPSV